MSQIGEVTRLTMQLHKLQRAGSGDPTGSYRSGDKERRSRVNHPMAAASSVMKGLLEFLPRAMCQSMKEIQYDHVVCWYYENKELTLGKKVKML